MSLQQIFKVKFSGQAQNKIFFSENALSRMHQIFHEYLFFLLKMIVKILYKIIEINSLGNFFIFHHRIHIGKSPVGRIHMAGSRYPGIHFGPEFGNDFF